MQLPHRTLIIACLLALVASATALVPKTGAQELGESKELKTPAPEFDANLTWLNSPPLSMEKLRGKVVLIDFWEYTCSNCIQTYPYLKQWHQKYADKGLVIVGVHTPEFQFAREEANVARSAKEKGLTYPLVLDPDYRVWNAYKNRYWPAKYLIDAEGDVRYIRVGEGAYGTTEAKIQQLLKEIDPSVQLPSITEPVRDSDVPGAVCYPVTPELYLGYERGGQQGSLGNRGGYQPGKLVNFINPGRWVDGRVYAHGVWKNNSESLESTRSSPHPSDYIAIRYHALGVNAVLKPERGKPVRVFVDHDGKPVAMADRGEDIQYDEQGRSYLSVETPRMYHIIQNAKYGKRMLRLTTGDPGVGVYSFTFVSCRVATP
jgi:thiol-disulfide isomerase/thioredoxin